MCSDCGMSFCPTSCPNSTGPETVYICKECGEPIVAGEEYYEMDGDFYHEDCFEDAAVKILMNDCGAIRGIADPDDGR